MMVEAIWDSIAEDTIAGDLAIEESEKQEIIRRLDEFKKGDRKTYTWDEVKMYAKEP